MLGWNKAARLEQVSLTVSKDNGNALKFDLVSQMFYQNERELVQNV